MVLAALGMVVASGMLYCRAPDRNRATRVRAGAVIGRVAVAVALPVPLRTAAGQFALWWSLPWGIGLVLAATLPTPATRRAALLTVAASVLFTLACFAAGPVDGFGLRLPDV